MVLIDIFICSVIITLIIIGLSVSLPQMKVYSRLPSIQGHSVFFFDIVIIGIVNILFFFNININVLNYNFFCIFLNKKNLTKFIKNKILLTTFIIYTREQ